MDIKEILNSLFAAAGTDKAGFSAGTGPVASRNSGSKTGSFEDVLARLTAPGGQSPSGRGASASTVPEGAVNAPAGFQGGVRGEGPSTGASSGNAGGAVASSSSLPSSEALAVAGTVHPGEPAQAGKALASLAEDLSKLLALLSGLQNMSPSQAQAALVAASGGQVTPSEARAFLNDLNAFIQKTKGASNPLQLPPGQQDALLVQLLQQLAQSQQVLWGAPSSAGNSASGADGNGSGNNPSSQLQLLFPGLGETGGRQTGTAGDRVLIQFQNFQMVAFFGRAASGEQKGLPASMRLDGALAAGAGPQPLSPSDVAAVVNQALNGVGDSGGKDVTSAVPVPNLPDLPGNLDRNFRALVQLLFQSGVSRAVLASFSNQGNQAAGSASNDVFTAPAQLLPDSFSGSQGAAPPAGSAPQKSPAVSLGQKSPGPGASAFVVETSAGMPAASGMPPQAPSAPSAQDTVNLSVPAGGKNRDGMGLGLEGSTASNDPAVQTVSTSPAQPDTAEAKGAVSSRPQGQPSAEAMVSVRTEPAAAKGLPADSRASQGGRSGSLSESTPQAASKPSTFSGETSKPVQSFPADRTTAAAPPASMDTAPSKVTANEAAASGKTSETGRAVSAVNAAPGQGSPAGALSAGSKGDVADPSPAVQNEPNRTFVPQGPAEANSVGKGVSSNQASPLPGPTEVVSNGNPASAAAVVDPTTNGSNPAQGRQQAADMASTASPNPGSQPAVSVVSTQVQAGSSAAAAVSSGEVGKTTLQGAVVNNTASVSTSAGPANPSVNATMPISAEAVTAASPDSGPGLAGGNGLDLNKNNSNSGTQGGLSLNAGTLLNGTDSTVNIASTSAPSASSLPANGAVDSSQVLTQITQQVAAQAATAHTVSRLSFQLVPQSLGRVTVQIVLADQSVSARIVVTNPDVREVMQHHMVELRTSLNQAGLQIDQLQVQVGGGSSNLMGQYYQYQQEGFGGYRTSSTPASLTPEEPKNLENIGFLATSSARMSLVDVLI